MFLASKDCTSFADFRDLATTSEAETEVEDRLHKIQRRTSY